MSKIISTDEAPQAIGPYSQAVKSGGLLFLSGQIPLNKQGEMNDGDIEAKTRQVFKNIEAILAAENLGLSHVIKVNIYLVDIANFDTVNQVMSSLFTAPYPARALVQVAALPKASEVEVEVVAEAPQSN